MAFKVKMESSIEFGTCLNRERSVLGATGCSNEESRVTVIPSQEKMFDLVARAVDLCSFGHIFRTTCLCPLPFFLKRKLAGSCSFKPRMTDRRNNWIHPLHNMALAYPTVTRDSTVTRDTRRDNCEQRIKICNLLYKLSTEHTTFKPYYRRQLQSLRHCVSDKIDFLKG